MPTTTSWRKRLDFGKCQSSSSDLIVSNYAERRTSSIDGLFEAIKEVDYFLLKIEKIVLIKHSTAEHKQSGEEDWAFPADNSKAVEEVNKEYSEKLRRTVLLTLEWLKRKQNVADAYRNLI